MQGPCEIFSLASALTNPLTTHNTICTCSSIGRALVCRTGGSGIETRHVRHYWSCSLTILLLYAACLRSRRKLMDTWGFESLQERQVSVSHAPNLPVQSCWRIKSHAQHGVDMGSNAKPITGVMQVGSIPIGSIIYGLPW